MSDQTSWTRPPRELISQVQVRKSGGWHQQVESDSRRERRLLLFPFDSVSVFGVFEACQLVCSQQYYARVRVKLVALLPSLWVQDFLKAALDLIPGTKPLVLAEAEKRMRHPEELTWCSSTLCNNSRPVVGQISPSYLMLKSYRDSCPKASQLHCNPAIA